MPLINFMATSEKGPLFIKSIDGTKEYKDKHFIVDLFLKVIGEVGHQYVVQIITDNASVMKATRSIVEANLVSATASNFKGEYELKIANLIE